MPEIGLFPLELVLLPTERVPLHIFEDRYRELIGESLTSGNEFGIVLEDADGLRDVGTSAGVVELVHTFDDGRMNILVEGRSRFRVRELTEGHSYRTAEVEEFDDHVHEVPTEAETERTLQAFRRLAEVADAEEVDVPAVGEAPLSFRLAARVDFGTMLKQELLELRSERARLDRLVDLLGHAAAALAREREVRERASGNGKVTRE